MMIGRNAIFGMGKPTEMIGSKNQRMNRLRDIEAPSAIPSTAAMTNPVMARVIVSPRLIHKSPLTASA